MPDRMSSKLGAYLDGELDQRAAAEVQAHLEACPTCRAELEELRQLSQLLRASPRPAFPPAHEFKSQVMLQLPRQSPSERSNGRAQELPPRSNLSLLPFAAPTVILVGWFFIQALAGVFTLLSWGGQADWIGSLYAWLGGSQQMLWISGAQAALGGMLGPSGQTSLSLLNDAGLFTFDLLLALAWQAAVALLYWGALFLAWRAQDKFSWFSPVEG